MTRASLITAFVLVVGLPVVFGGCGGGGGGGGSSAGTISFSQAAFTVNENGTTVAPVTVERTGGSVGAVSATILLSGGSATGGVPPLAPPSDYDDTPIVVMFAAGDSTPQVISVPVLDDNLVEGGETVSLSLGSPAGGAAIGTVATATLTIVDDDAFGALQFSAPTFSYQENGTPVAAITVQRLGGIDGAVSVLVTSSDDTANSDPNSMMEPVDFLPLNAVVFFGDQDGADKIVPFTIISDLLPEVDETLTVALSQPGGGAVVGAQSSATVTILDDDTLLTIPNPSPMPNDNFGFTVATVGRRMAVGAPAIQNAQGKVPLYDPAFGTVVTTFTVQPQQLGISLAGDGVNLMMGAVQGSGGSVWIYDAYTLAFRFNLNTGETQFGRALAALGDGRIAVAAPGSNVIRIFDNLTGFPLQTISTTTTTTPLAVINNDLLFGAPQSNFVERLSGDPLVPILVIDTPVFFPAPPFPSFGEGLGSIGAEIIVGAPDDDGPGLNAGVVHRFDDVTGVLLQTIPPPVVLANGRFGATIAIVRDRICVQQEHGGPLSGGRIYVLDNQGVLVQTIDNPTPSANGDFGGAMCEFDGALVVGAPAQDVGAQADVGVAYIFKVN
jgi:Calx-beta domain